MWNKPKCECGHSQSTHKAEYDDLNCIKHRWGCWAKGCDCKEFKNTNPSLEKKE